MAIKRVHVGFTPAQIKALEKLKLKWGLDTTNTIRHCVARIAEQEGITQDKPRK